LIGKLAILPLSGASKSLSRVFYRRYLWKMAGRKVSDNWGQGQTGMEKHGLCTGGPCLPQAPAMTGSP